MSLTSPIPRQNGAAGQPLNQNSGLFGFTVPNTDAGSEVGAQMAAGSQPSGVLTANRYLASGDVMVSPDGLGRCTITSVDVRGSLVTINHEFGALEASENGFTRIADPAEAKPAPATFESVFASTLESAPPEFWTGLAEDEKTPKQMLHLMAVHGDANLRRAVADNDAIAEDTRDLLSRDEDEDVRAATIYWFAADAEFLSRFEGDDEYSVVEALGRAKGIDPEQLRRVSEYEWSSAYDVIQNPAITADLFAELYEAGSPLTRRAAIGSSKADVALIERATADADPSVRAAALRSRLATSALLDAHRGDLSAEVREAIASSSRCSPETTGFLHGDESKSVRDALASRLRSNRY